jgi:hypothetical protein
MPESNERQQVEQNVQPGWRYLYYVASALCGLFLVMPLITGALWLGYRKEAVLAKVHRMAFFLSIAGVALTVVSVVSLGVAAHKALTDVSAGNQRSGSDPSTASASPAASAIRQAPSDEQARAVKAATRALLSYDYRHLAEDRAQGEAAAAEPFLQEYLNTFDRTVRPMAQKFNVAVAAEVSAVGLVGPSDVGDVYLAFIDQKSRSSSRPGESLTQTYALVTVNASEHVTRLVTAEDTDIQTPLEAEVLATYRPLLTLGEKNFEADSKSVLDHASGKFLKDFREALPSLRAATLGQHVQRIIDGRPIVAISSYSGEKVVALVQVTTIVHSRAMPEATQTARWRLTLVRDRTGLTLDVLEPVG